MSKLNVILIVVLALQGVIVAVQRVGGEPEVAQAGPFLEGLTRASVQQVAMDDGENQVTLRRNDAGWGVAEAADYPANGEKIDEVLHDLVALTTREAVSHSPAHHVDLQVADADFNRKVTVSTTDGERTFFVGKSGRGGSTFVRRDGEDTVYAVSDFSPHKLTARSAAWLDRVVFEVDRDRIEGIGVRNENGSFRLQREALDAWQLVGVEGELDTAEVNKLLGKVATVRLKEVAGAADEIPLGQLTAEVTVYLSVEPLPATFDPDAIPVIQEPPPIGHTIQIAPRPDDDKTFWARLNNDPHVVELTHWAIKPLLETAAEDLLAE